jgi:hypothetical protein
LTVRSWIARERIEAARLRSGSGLGAGSGGAETGAVQPEGAVKSFRDQRFYRADLRAEG